MFFIHWLGIALHFISPNRSPPFPAWSVSTRIGAWASFALSPKSKALDGQTELCEDSPHLRASSCSVCWPRAACPTSHSGHASRKRRLLVPNRFLYARHSVCHPKSMATGDLSDECGVSELNRLVTELSGRSSFLVATRRAWAAGTNQAQRSHSWALVKAGLSLSMSPLPTHGRRMARIFNDFSSDPPSVDPISDAALFRRVCLDSLVVSWPQSLGYMILQEINLAGLPED